MSTKNQMSNLPTPSVGGLSFILLKLKNFQCLMQRKNICLAKNWRENGNLQSAHKLSY